LNKESKRCEERKSGRERRRRMRAKARTRRRRKRVSSGNWR
jgi:hypothetical protein